MYYSSLQHGKGTPRQESLPPPRSRHVAPPFLRHTTAPPPDVQSDDLLYSVSSGLFLANVITLIPRLLLHVSIYHVSIYLRAHGTGMMWNPHCIDLLEPSTPNDYEEEVTVVTHEYTIYNRCTAAQLHTYIVKQCLM